MIVDMEKIKKIIDEINNPHIKAILEIDYREAERDEKNKEELIRRFNNFYNENPEMFV